MVDSASSAEASSRNGIAPSDIHVFGVRHLSPMGAWQLRQFLDQIQPDLIMIEGLSDADELVPDITRSGSVPPIAILAYSDSVPVRTLVYPFAKYSPEYQAIVWAKENKTKTEFIDLPSDIFLAMQNLNLAEVERDLANEESASDEADAEAEFQAEVEVAENEDTAKVPAPQAPWLERISLYEQIAQQAGEHDYDTYWERHFEHNQSLDSYRQTTFQLGLGLRELESATRPDWAENLLREAFMRRKIQSAIARGIEPQRIVAVVGAYHASVLGSNLPAMTDEELAHLPRLASKLTLMPYSYFKLSSQSGYGAGNEAPAYYELLWDSLEQNGLNQLASRYLTGVTRTLRERGTHRSTAAVIEGVRLARTLAALKNGTAPTLRDLQDAAITLIGLGDRGVVAESLARIEVGTAIGRLPKGVSQTSIQEDFQRTLERLKLTKYQTTVKTDLSLDLRENRTAKTAESAFLDLNRSSFLHRLNLLGIGFAKQVSTRQQSTTWAENWALQWSPESEIQLVESVLLGETVELAASFKFKTEIDECQSIHQAAAIVKTAVQCSMMPSMELARSKLQQLAAESSEFTAIAGAATELSQIVRFGDVRNYNAAPLVPLIEELFVQGALGLLATANCDDAAAKKVAAAMDQLHKVGQEHHANVDEALWQSSLRKLADADDRNPLLSGYACAILLEENLIGNDELAREVSRRLSPGIAADLGAGWFEGMAGRNRYALIARQVLWEQLQDYVKSLDDEQFRRALVFLRRAFGGFSPPEKRAICENLSHVWGVDADTASELLASPLTETETETLDELNQFDFDDF